ncbi:hypothetical protein D9M72_515490 [compost metagenome]
MVEIDGVDFVTGLHLDLEGADFLLIHRILRDVVDRALFGDLFELQWHGLAGQVFDRTAHLGHQWLAFLEHRDIDHALVLAADQFGGLGNVRGQVGGVEGVVVHRHVTEGFLAFALDGFGAHGGDAQAGSE